MSGRWLPPAKNLFSKSSAGTWLSQHSSPCRSNTRARVPSGWGTNAQRPVNPKRRLTLTMTPPFGLWEGFLSSHAVFDGLWNEFPRGSARSRGRIGNSASEDLEGGPLARVGALLGEKGELCGAQGGKRALAGDELAV